MNNNEDAKNKALESVLQRIEKTHGKGSIMVLGEKKPEPVPVISTGAFSLDYCLGVGGYPRGRMIEIYGPEASGKTTLALHAIAEAQHAGGVAAFIDAEHALDLNYAQNLGVNTSKLLLSQPDFGEQALNITEELISSNALDIVVVDSVAALVPRAEIEGDMGDSQMGVHARLMSQAMRKLTGTVSKSKTVLIFINQLRSKIGVFFGSNETTTGGNALKFYATIRIDVRRIGALKEGAVVKGNRTKIKIVKNKVASPFKEVELDLIYGKGISRISDIIDRAVDAGVIKKGGAWFTYGEEKFQGKDAVELALYEHPDLYKQIFAEVYKIYYPVIAAPEPALPAVEPDSNNPAAVDVMILKDSELEDEQ